MDQFMVINIVLLWASVFLNLLLTFALIRKVNASNLVPRLEGPKIASPIPAFSAETLEGKVVTQANYAHRSTLFMFVQSHCSACHTILPQVELLSPQARITGIEIVLVSTDEPDEARDFVRQNNIQLPVLIAPQQSNSMQANFKIPGTPYFCLINKDGVVQSAGFPTSSQEWKALIKQWEPVQLPVMA
jgi:peroxiredoxin